MDKEYTLIAELEFEDGGTLSLTSVGDFDFAPDAAEAASAWGEECEVAHRAEGAVCVAAVAMDESGTCYEMADFIG